MIEPASEFHKRIVIGVEIEAYSIDASDYQIGRRLSRPRPGLSESGERFARDSSIGSEYNSRPFATVREALFLLKNGLRKYLRGFYRSQDPKPEHRVPLLVGGWTNRSAGTHLHLSVADQPLSQEDAWSLAWHIHDHIPLLIAVGANSPVWDKRLTNNASNRFLRGSDVYFLPIRRGELDSEPTRELVYNPGRVRKPPTLEIRVLDSNIPEYISISICLVKAIALRWLKRKSPVNQSVHGDYIWARLDAGKRGMKAKLPWNGEWLTAAKYLDRFIWEYREEFEEMDIPEDVFDVIKLVKRGFNGAKLIREAAVLARREHPQTWQRRFAKRYSQGLENLLSGNTLRDFSASLNVALPSTERVWLGRKSSTIGA